VAGLVANLTTRFLEEIGRLVRTERTELASLSDLYSSQTLTDGIVLRLNGSGFKQVGDLPGDVQQLLASIELENLVFDLLAYTVSPSAHVDHLDLIRNQYDELFKLYCGLDSKAESVRPAIFSGLVQGCDAAYDQLLQKRKLLSDETLQVIERQLLQAHLNAIQLNLRLLRQPGHPTLDDLNSFLEQYRGQLIFRHKKVSPPSWTGEHKVDIDSIYVSPTILDEGRVSSNRRSRLLSPEISQYVQSGTRFVDADDFIQSSRPLRAETIGFDPFVSSIRRSIILGDPGGGKTSLSAKLCRDLAEAKPTSGELIPILVILREFGNAKKKRNCSVLSFIEENSSAFYQIAPPPGAFEFFLLSGKALVIFDGLDELLDTADRRAIRSDVEAFANLYPHARVLVTSRIVGYEEAPLDSSVFHSYRLTAFDLSQVASYVHNWFRLESELLPSEQTAKAEAFLEESEIVDDIRRNPLMLGLLCNIYRGENYIPSNRPDIYEKCATMLFERWDTRRNLRVSLPISTHVRPAMMYLASVVYESPDLQSGIRERQLVKMTRDYLLDRRFTDVDEATQAASEFVAFCVGRAWVFSDVGTTSNGEHIFQFSHRTFLEYFTAAHIVRTHPTVPSLTEYLLPRIERAEWDTVSQLAVQIHNSQLEGSADIFLSRLVQHAELSDARIRNNVLSFAARALGFVVPRDTLSKRIASACASWALTATPGKNTFWVRPLTELASAANENERPVLDGVTEQLAAAMSSEGESDAGALALALPNWSDDREGRGERIVRGRPRRIKGWLELPADVNHRSDGRLATWALKTRSTAAAACAQNVVSSVQAVDHLGLEALFVVGRAAPWIPLETSSIVMRIVNTLKDHMVASPCHQGPNEELGAFYPTLLAAPKPWIHLALKPSDLFRNKAFADLEGWSCPDSTSESRSALLLLTLPGWEIEARELPMDSICRSIVEARRGEPHLSDSRVNAEGSEILRECPISAQAKEFVENWIHRKFDLVGI